MQIFLWYARAIHPMILTPLSVLALQQTAPTINTMKQVKQCFNHAATKEPAIDMVLAAHSNAGKLKCNARSRAGQHHLLSEIVHFLPNNGAIQNVAKIIAAVTSSTTKDELSAFYQHPQSHQSQRNAQEMRHPKPPHTNKIRQFNSIGHHE